MIYYKKALSQRLIIKEALSPLSFNEQQIVFSLNPEALEPNPIETSVMLDQYFAFNE